MTYSIDSICDKANVQFNFPKAELHCHLDGCFRLPTLIEMAKKRGIDLPSYEPEELRSLVCVLERKKDLFGYLTGFFTTTPPIAGSKENLFRHVQETVEDKLRSGVRYIELRFSPQFLANCDVTPILNGKKGDVTPRDVVETICKAAKQAEKDFPITIRLILCCFLDFPEWSMEVAHFCKEFADQGVVGIDIAGAARKNGPHNIDHVKAFDFCKENGIHITVHAGEAGDAYEVDEAMKFLHAERIGHGYHTVDDEEVYAESKRRKVHFEVCPISSFATASVDPDLSRHPAIRFCEDGVNFSLSTDDPGVHQKTLLDDYSVAFTKFKFSVETLKQLNLNALRSSFCEEPIKEKLIKEFEKAYQC